MRYHTRKYIRQEIGASESKSESERLDQYLLKMEALESKSSPVLVAAELICMQRFWQRTMTGNCNGPPRRKCTPLLCDEVVSSLGPDVMEGVLAMHCYSPQPSQPA